MYNKEEVEQVLREALAWGATYGPVIPKHQWDELRNRLVDQFSSRLLEN